MYFDPTTLSNLNSKHDSYINSIGIQISSSMNRQHNESDISSYKLFSSLNKENIHSLHNNSLKSSHNFANETMKRPEELK